MFTNRADESAARGRTIAYWSTTVGIIAFLTVGGVSDLLRVDFIRVIMEEQLGYPPFLASILGVWKLGGALALAVPGFPRLKEWAYAGAVFTYTGAAASHLAVSDRPGALLPALIAAIALASWALRPASRRLPVPDVPAAPLHPSSLSRAS